MNAAMRARWASPLERVERFVRDERAMPIAGNKPADVTPASGSIASDDAAIADAVSSSGEPFGKRGATFTGDAGGS